MKLTRPRLAAVLALIAVVLLTPSAARADTGIPMLPFAYPVLVVLLLPVIGVEALYLWLKLNRNLAAGAAPAMRWWLIARHTALANALSTLVGFPLAWLLGVILEIAAGGLIVALGASGYPPVNSDTLIGKVAIVIFSAPWLGPNLQSGRWQLVLAFVVLMVPAFFTSYYFEWWVMRWSAWSVDDASLRKLVRSANLLSYVFLTTFGALVLYFGLNFYLR